jgi:hypothetical protein
LVFRDARRTVRIDVLRLGLVAKVQDFFRRQRAAA